MNYGNFWWETWCISVSFSLLISWSSAPTYEGQCWKYNSQRQESPQGCVSQSGHGPVDLSASGLGLSDTSSLTGGFITIASSCRSTSSIQASVFFFILAKQSNLCQLSSTSETQGTLFMFHFEGRADILFVAYIPLSLYGLRFIICGFLISDTSTTALIPAQIDAFIGLHIQLSAGLPRAFSPQMSWI